MSDFFIGFFGVLFFGGSLLLVFFKAREKLTWKIIGGSLIFVIFGFYMMIDSVFTSGETVIMESGNEIFNNKDTVVAGDYEYTITKVGTENTLEDYGTEINASGKYLIFEIRIKNNSNYPFSMETSANPPFYLLNQERYYEVNRDLSHSLTNDETGETGYWSSSNSINPGNETIGYAIFDIPEEIINSDQTKLLIPTDDSAPNDIYLNIN